MKKKIQEFFDRSKFWQKRENEKIKDHSIPRTLAVRKFLHFLHRKKDRGSSKS